MLFQPAIIALLLASSVSALMLLASGPFALSLIRHWDIRSGSERQLGLERRTYLMSTLLAFVFATQLVALLLFIFNADKMSVMFIKLLDPGLKAFFPINKWHVPPPFKPRQQQS